VLLMVVDVMAAELAIGVASLFYSWFDSTVSVLGFDGAILGLGISCIVIANGCMGLYDTAAGGSIERFRRRVLAALLLPAPALAFIALSRPATFPIVVLLVTASALVVPLGLIGEACLRRVWPEAWNARTLLVGDGATVGQLAAHFAVRPELGLRPVGFVSDDPAGAPASLSWLGRLPDLNDLVEGVDVVVIAPSPDLSALSPTRLPVQRVVIVPDTTSVPNLWFSARDFGDMAGLEFFNPTQNGPSRRIKRALEFCIAVPISLLTLPLIGMVALAIKGISPGPAFYVQKRIGWKGTPVAIYKLRSMYLDADARLQEVLGADPEARREWERFMKLSRDPRILPYIGSFMRKTSIDELPQLWAVIRGDLSLVGPRPLPPYHLDKFGSQFQRLRASVKPGLTGLWQVSERSNADLREQERIDTFYIRNWSLWLDAYIVMRTVPAVFGGKGAR
jgi:Undecaprenyl-phosphate galactose phosphotransferase WbaP